MPQTLEAATLYLLGNDYAAPRTIIGDLTAKLNPALSEAQVYDLLWALVEQGVAQAFIHDAESEEFLPLSSAAAAQRPEAWFKRSPRYASMMA
jgi:hypothetical protein